ncbi:MAG TPA: hypothetical protein VF719_01885 [Abditibacteriaceae bacterium]|jgi:hypothetical protein
MKIITRKSFVLGTGILSMGFGIANPLEAAPRSNDVREERREVKEARKEVRQERKDVRKADSAAQRRQEQRQLNEAKRDLRNERRDVREERRENNAPVWNAPRPNGNAYGYYNNRPGYQAPAAGGYRPGYGNAQNQGQVGTVTNVRGAQLFDVNIGGTVYNVYTVSGLPIGLNRGDIVRVVGTRVGGNDIRESRVFIVSNG